MRFSRVLVALAVMLGVGVALVVRESAAADPACTKYVVTAPTSVEVWDFPEPTPYYEIWTKWPPGRVFCVVGQYPSGRLQVEVNCPPQQCDPSGVWPGWVDNDPAEVAPLNCTARTLTRSATVYTFPDTLNEAWMSWPSGTSFCDFGRNAAGTRYKVYLYCSLPSCHRPEGTWVGWVSADPMYYSTTPPCRPWIPCPTPSAEA